MNENARKLYEDLAASRLPQFNMHNWCGSACCIGGNAMLRIWQERPDDTRRDIPEDEIAKWLGLSDEVGMDLFYPGSVEVRSIESHPWHGVADDDPYAATQQQAAKALKRACELSERTQ